ncbi:polysaccharide biosynthesis tyrosine autokinase [Paenarthrobacter nicotinovorans]|uniref:polysaccharide biosynthesis tyrosine autokinase n=1 Tax=Paenarthrobacter nicotinovorans TaxID=29320 RepID=UPI003D6715B1
MDIKDYLRIMRRNWMLVAALTLTGLLVGGAASMLIPPTYTAGTQLFVAIQNSGSAQELQQGNTFTQARVQSYVKTVTTPIVLQPAIDELGLGMTTVELAKKVKVSTDLNTVLVKIDVSDHSPVQAAAIAQSIANSLVKAVETLEKPKNGGASPVSLSIIAPAEAPSEPSAPNTKLNLALGLVLGLALGLGSALIRGTFDTRIRGEADLRHVTDAPVLGGITFDADSAKAPLLTDMGQHSLRAESYRTLRTNLKFANVSVRAGSFIVTSAMPGEGKSTTASNLALSLAQAGQRVCLVDADLRRPMVDQYFGLERSAGLTTALVGTADLDDLLQPWGSDDLYVLTSGAIPPNPSELLGSTEMQALINRLEQSFDTVVVDAPPLLPVTDAAVLSQHVGGVVLVVSAQKTRQPSLEKALQALELVQANLLGIVLNRLPAKGPDAYSYGYYNYESHETTTEFERLDTSRIAQSLGERRRRSGSALSDSDSDFTRVLEGKNR